ncbi:MAG: hypothetical protein IKN57_01100, partial [Parasporobacterium sp.]|nr:hypothetical protein [Parasporobacterium sp.]
MRKPVGILCKMAAAVFLCFSVMAAFTGKADAGAMTGQSPDKRELPKYGSYLNKTDTQAAETASQPEPVIEEELSYDRSGNVDVLFSGTRVSIGGFRFFLDYGYQAEYDEESGYIRVTDKKSDTGINIGVDEYAVPFFEPEYAQKMQRLAGSSGSNLMYRKFEINGIQAVEHFTCTEDDPSAFSYYLYEVILKIDDEKGLFISALGEETRKAFGNEIKKILLSAERLEEGSDGGAVSGPPAVSAEAGSGDGTDETGSTHRENDYSDKDTESFRLYDYDRERGCLIIYDKDILVRNGYDSDTILFLDITGTWRDFSVVYRDEMNFSRYKDYFLDHDDIEIQAETTVMNQAGIEFRYIHYENAEYEYDKDMYFLELGNGLVEITAVQEETAALDGILSIEEFEAADAEPESAAVPSGHDSSYDGPSGSFPEDGNDARNTETDTDTDDKNTGTIRYDSRDSDSGFVITYDKDILTESEYQGDVSVFLDI